MKKNKFSQFLSHLSEIKKSLQNDDANSYLKKAKLNEQSGDITQALFFYLKAAICENIDAKAMIEKFSSLGNGLAIYYLGVFFEHRRDWKKAEEYYEKAIEKEYILAMYHLGKLYQENRLSTINPGNVVISKNKTKELSLYRKAAKFYSKEALQALVTESNSNIDACIHLAEMYELGEGLTKNMSRAMEFYKKASELGSKNAAFYLGQLYQIDHEEVKKDTNQAIKYYSLAVKLGFQKAIAPLKRLMGIETSYQHPKSDRLKDRIQFNDNNNFFKSINLQQLNNIETLGTLITTFDAINGGPS